MESQTYSPGSMTTKRAVHISASLRNRKQALLVALLSFAIQWVGAAQNPRDNFCRRYGHQTTVIDDKLYIDGGYVNFDSYAQDHLNVPSMCFIAHLSNPEWNDKSLADMIIKILGIRS